MGRGSRYSITLHIIGRKDSIEDDSVCVCVFEWQSICVSCPHAETLTKLLHNTAASASFLCSQDTCKGLELILAPSKITCPRKQLTDSQANTSSYMTLSKILVIISLPHLPESSPCMPQSLPKPFFVLFSFQLTNTALAWESQSTPPMDPNKSVL